MSRELGVSDNVHFFGDGSVIEAIVRKGGAIKVNPSGLVESTTGFVFSPNNRNITQGIKDFFSGMKHFYLNGYANADSKLTIANPLCGNLVLSELKEPLVVCPDNLMLATDHINISAGIKEISTLRELKKTYRFVLLEGSGAFVLSALGGYRIQTLKRGESLYVLPGNALGWSTSMNVSTVRNRNGVINLVSRTNQIMLKFDGPGTLYLQTASLDSFKTVMLQMGFGLEADFFRSSENSLKKIRDDISALENAVKNNSTNISTSVSREEMYQKFSNDLSLLDPVKRQKLLDDCGALKKADISQRELIKRAILADGYSSDFIDWVVANKV